MKPRRLFRISQRTLERVTLRLAVERSLSIDEERGLAEKLVKFLGYRLVVDFDYCTPTISRGPGGKFEDFVCEISVGI